MSGVRPRSYREAMTPRVFGGVRPACLHLLPLLPAILLGCAPEPPPPPNVVLITIDTTRADAIGIGGHPDVRTPRLDAWARSGTQAAVAVVDVPITLPSHSSILTGLPAPVHGVRTNTNYRLGDGVITLAEELLGRGYRTGAIVSSRALDEDSGIHQGFQHFDDDLTTPYTPGDPSRLPADPRWLPPVDRRADEAVGRAIDWLRADDDRPFFLWLHLIDPHTPYDPPPPWGEARADLYLAELEFTDRQLMPLERELQRRGLAGTTLLIVTSDHGEGLDDHREDEHGLFVYEETIRVPLAMRGPGLPAGRILREQVRSIDIASTVLELALARDEPFGRGESLVPLALREGVGPEPAAYLETLRPRLHHRGSPLWSLRTDRRKFIWAPIPELYDLEADPGETRNLLAGGPEKPDAYLDELRHYAADLAAMAALAVSADSGRDASSLEALAALGYVAVDPGEAPDDLLDVEGLDPKDFVDVVGAGRDLDMGYPDRAERKTERFLRTADPPAERPELAPLWSVAHQNLAAVRLLRGENGAAAESYRESLHHDPANGTAAWGLVYALNRDGRPAQALREADRLGGPEADPQLRLHRALALALLDRREEAREELARVQDRLPEGARETCRRLAQELAAGRTDLLDRYAGR